MRKRDKIIWINLINLAMSVFMLAFNTSALVNALPVICIQYGLKVSSLQWIMNIYLMAAASFILVGGKLGDIFNRKTLFILFSAIYALASLLIAVSDSAPLLFSGRLIQGICAAFVASGSLAFVKITFPQERMGMALGLWSGIIGIGCAIGPFLGGILTDFISWKAIFWLNFALMGTVVFLSARYLPRQPGQETPASHLDWPGFIVFTLSIVSVVYGLFGASVTGIQNIKNLGFIAEGLLLFYLFVLLEMRTKHPLLHLSFLKNKLFLCGCVGLFTIILSETAVPYFLNMFAQNASTFNYSPGAAGTLSLPFTISMFSLSFCVDLFQKFSGGRMRAIWISYSVLICGLAMLVSGCYYASMAAIIAGLVVSGAGLGIVGPLLNTVCMTSIPDDNAGEASGIVNTLAYLAELSAIVVCSIFYFETGHIKLGALSVYAQNTTLPYSVMDELLLGKGQVFANIVNGFSPEHKTDAIGIVRDAVSSGAAMTYLFLLAVTVTAIAISLKLAKNR